MLLNNKCRTKFNSFNIWIILLFLIFFPERTFTQTSTHTPWEGKEVFREKGCSLCHAVYGKGGKDAPDLGEKQFYGTNLELAAMMWNHFPKMYKKMEKMEYKFKEFSEEEMSKLLDYFSYIRYIGEPGNEYQGRKLLDSKKCRNCHKFGGVGGDIGPEIGDKTEYLSPLRFVEAMWNHGPGMLELFEKNNIKRPEFKGHDIVDIAFAVRSYIFTSSVPIGSYDIGNPQKGEILAKEKGCMLCHSFRGEGGDLAVDFDNVDFNYSVTEIAGEMWNHAPEMWKVMKSKNINIPVFKEGEMADIIAYLYSLKVNDNPGDAENGPKIISDMGCLSCHSLNGKGGDIAVDLVSISSLESPKGMITAMWNHAPAMQNEQLLQKLKWPEFSGQEIADLYAYLRSMREPASEPK